MEAYSVFFCGYDEPSTDLCLHKLYRDGFANAVLNNGMKLYNELCNLSKYSYAMKKGLTKQNYTKYTKKVVLA